MTRRSRIALLFAAALSAAAVFSAACSSSSGGGGATPTPSGTPFNPIGCQLVWVRHNPAGQSQKIDYYLVDAPSAKWTTGTNGYYVGDPTGATNVTGAFVSNYDVVTHASAGAALASSGVFGVGTDSADPLAIGNPVSFSDGTPQSYFLLDSAGNLTADQGASGTGTMQAVWSAPGSPDVTPGSGTITISWMGSSITLGNDLAYGLCYTTTPFAPLTEQEKIAEAGARAARALAHRR